MTKVLRPYQQKIVDEILHELKLSTNPILIDASVGSGKSLILACVLLVLERAGFRALCLTLNSTLIDQNANTYKLQGGNPGIYCASLNAKNFEEMVIFASPHSVCKDINKKGNVSNQPFRLIIVDECHQINFHDSSSMYMRIINHYSMLAQLEGYSFRIIGLSGTCYRGKAESIVGPNMLFKSKLCSISTPWLVEQGFLVKPHFGITQADTIDFSECKVLSTGNFATKDLEHAIHKNERLTGEIMRELQTIKCNGIFIFASTRKHCEECARSLPDGTWAIITGETPHEDRRKYLSAAMEGNLRYLISVNCLNVGVDVPRFDCCAWLRPTESLILYTQGIGRVLRLYPGKESAIVLDYAGNLDRHGDVDDPIINEALQPREENEKDYCIPCYTCKTLNTVTARRCIGMHNEQRCHHYFEFKDCLSCGEPNDITSRHCRLCECELIDPNAKLTKIENQWEFHVSKAEYWITKSDPAIINAQYNCGNQAIFESFTTNSPKSRNILYAKFIRIHCEEPSQWYPRLQEYQALYDMIYQNAIHTPNKLICKRDVYGRFHVVKKLFQTIE